MIHVGVALAKNISAVTIQIKNFRCGIEKLEEILI